MSRLTLSDADKQARDWFVETTKSLGCDVKIDAMGELSNAIKSWVQELRRGQETYLQSGQERKEVRQHMLVLIWIHK